MKVGGRQDTDPLDAAPGGCLWWWEDAPAGTDMLRLFVFTSSDLGTLFLGRKKMCLYHLPLPHNEDLFQFSLFAELYRLRQRKLTPDFLSLLWEKENMLAGTIGYGGTFWWNLTAADRNLCSPYPMPYPPSLTHMGQQPERTSELQPPPTVFVFVHRCISQKQKLSWEVVFCESRNAHAPCNQVIFASGFRRQKKVPKGTG